MGRTPSLLTTIGPSASNFISEPTASLVALEVEFESGAGRNPAVCGSSDMVLARLREFMCAASIYVMVLRCKSCCVATALCLYELNRLSKPVDRRRDFQRLQHSHHMTATRRVGG